MSQIAYTRTGSGTPIVLIHGIGSRWQVFEPIIGLLATRHEVIALDLPGFGASPSDDSVEASAPGYARWLASFLSDHGIRAPHVVGNSMGGGIALELARNGHASRVTAFSPIGFWRQPGRVWCQVAVSGIRELCRHAPRLVERLTEPALTRGALLGAFYGRPARVSPHAAIADVRGLIGATSFPAACRAFSAYRFLDDDRIRRVPVTIAWGTRDVLLTYRTQSRRARAQLGWARHVALPRCGHLPFHDDPYACASTILQNPPTPS